ncbi:MAG TPA: cupin domain-containing protein [Gemmatimonadaceae bacterium]|nr:cupin domain-containing protein [Gemmatimonadaceae bacterium]
MPSAVRHTLGPDEGEMVHLYALGVRFMVEGSSTEGRFSVVEHPMPPRSLGSPVHTHLHEDEFSYVLEGRVGVQIGDDVVVAGPGELIFKPRGIPHAFWNAGDEPARLLEIISRAGFENYFRAMAPLLAAPVRDDAAVAAVAKRYDLDIDFSTIPVLAERHGLRLER